MSLTVADIALIVGIVGACLVAIVAGCLIVFFCCGGFGQNRGGGCCGGDDPGPRSSLNIAVIKRSEPNRRKIHIMPPINPPFFPGQVEQQPQGMMGFPPPPPPPEINTVPMPPMPPPPPPPPAPAAPPKPQRQIPAGRKIDRNVAEDKVEWGRDFNFKKDADSSNLVRGQVLPNI